MQTLQTLCIIFLNIKKKLLLCNANIQLLSASLLTNFRKKLWNVEDQPEGQQQPYAASNRYCIYKKEDIASTQHHTSFNILYLTIEFYYFNQFLEVLISLLWRYKGAAGLAQAV
jgi:hypothetical protein